jgi:hypothetical protein
MRIAVHPKSVSEASERDILAFRDGIGCPRIWEDLAMRFSSLFVAKLAVAILSIAPLLCGLSGTAMSRTATPSDATISLPNVVVEAPRRVARPKQVATPKHRAVARSTVSRRTSPANQTSSAAPGSVSAKLAKLASVTGSCAGGCVTSFRSCDAPWHGCSSSAGTYSLTCRNVGNYKTYDECREAGLLTGWRSNEVAGYCTSLALK